MASDIEKANPETELEELTNQLGREPNLDDEQQLQIVSFLVDARQFGVHILHVREVIRVPSLTRVPNAPKWLAGVANLRGSVLPVISLRKSSTEGRTRTENLTDATASAIVVLDPNGKAVGVLADSAPEVLKIPAAAVSLPPRAGCADPEYVFGMVRLGSRLLVLLDPDRVVAAAIA